MSAAPGRAAELLEAVVRAAQGAGERLRAEFFRPSGPRGARGKAPVDTEIELGLRETLQRLLACSFLGEETGFAAGALAGWRWLVDPHDGTTEFLKGNRGSAVSIALLRGEGLAAGAAAHGVRAEAVLGVVHAPLAPDRGADTIAWAEGCACVQRNGRPVESGLARRPFGRGELVWLTASSALRPGAFSQALAPARFIAMPSIAYRLARVAAGDGAATLSLHSVNEYDIGAGAALVRAAGGILRDRLGREIVFGGAENALVEGCFAGAPDAVQALTGKDWESVLRVPKIAPRIALAFPRSDDEARLARAQGCLLGHVIGSGFGSPTGAQAGEIGPLAGSGEPALALARALVRERRFDAGLAHAAYLDWLESDPPDAHAAMRAGLAGKPDFAGASSAPLLRIAPIGVWAAGDPERAADAAREDCALTHRSAECVEACAGYAAAIAAGVAGASRATLLAAALAHCTGPARAAIERAAKGLLPRGGETAPVLNTLQNAFYQLLSAPGFEAGLSYTARIGGDACANGAIAGALLGAFHGRAAIPARWLMPVLAGRPCAESGAARPRPMAFWPDDVLELAEALGAPAA